jgi:hypothetical protein
VLNFAINIVVAVVVLCFIKESIMTHPYSYCILPHAVDVIALVIVSFEKCLKICLVNEDELLLVVGRALLARVGIPRTAS